MGFPSRSSQLVSCHQLKRSTVTPRYVPILMKCNEILRLVKAASGTNYRPETLKMLKLK